MTTKKKQPKLVMIVWRDAYASFGPHEADEDLAPFTPVATLGILLREDKEKNGSLYVAAEEVGGGEFRGITVIPKTLVIRRERLQRKRN